MDKSVTLETKCWEGDWKKLLKGDRLKSLHEKNCFEFSERILYINNVNDYGLVTGYAERAISLGYITKYVLVKDYAEEALHFFGLKVEDFGRGYVYSISELVSIFLCQTEFLLHFASDVIPKQEISWVLLALDLMREKHDIKVANLNWSDGLDEAQSESEYELDDFFVGYGFSDQNYLVRTSDFRKQIYGEKNPLSERYPAYGGELFEKRVDAWMRNHGCLRATFKHGSYLHENPIPSLASRFVGKMRRISRRLGTWVGSRP